MKNITRATTKKTYTHENLLTQTKQTTTQKTFIINNNITITTISQTKPYTNNTK